MQDTKGRRIKICPVMSIPGPYYFWRYLYEPVSACSRHLRQVYVVFVMPNKTLTPKQQYMIDQVAATMAIEDMPLTPQAYENIRELIYTHIFLGYRLWEISVEIQWYFLYLHS